MRRIFEPPGRLEPKQVGVGYVVYAVQRGSKTAVKDSRKQQSKSQKLACTGKSLLVHRRFQV